LEFNPLDFGEGGDLSPSPGEGRPDPLGRIVGQQSRDLVEALDNANLVEPSFATPPETILAALPTLCSALETWHRSMGLGVLRMDAAILGAAYRDLASAVAGATSNVEPLTEAEVVHLVTSNFTPHQMVRAAAAKQLEMVWPKGGET
jgi:hypothetical protein